MHSLNDLPTLCYSRVGFLVPVSLHLIYVSQDLGSIHSALRQRPQDVRSRSAEAAGIPMPQSCIEIYLPVAPELLAIRG